MELQNSKLKGIGKAGINLHGGKGIAAGVRGLVLVSISLAATGRKEESELVLKPLS